MVGLLYHKWLILLTPNAFIVYIMPTVLSIEIPACLGLSGFMQITFVTSVEMRTP